MKLTKKRVITGAIALAMMATMFVGCGKSDQPQTGTGSPDSPAKDEVTTITLSTWSDEKLEMEKIIGAFEASQSNIKVDMMEYPSAEYKDKLTIQLAGGSDIDIITHKSTADYADIASKGQLLNLEPLVERDNVDVSSYGPAYEGLKIDGEIGGIPSRKTAWVLYYNKDLFDAAGVDYPSQDMTWDDFRALAKKMTTDKVAGAYLHTWPIVWYGMGLQKGASVVDKDLTPFKEALQYRMDLEADGSIMSFTDAIATNAHYKTEFGKGQTAMNIMGEFHVSQLRDLEASGDMTFDWDIVPVPHLEGVEPNTTWGTVNPVSINRKSKKQDASWEFLKFLTGEEGAKIYAAAGKLPGYVNDEIQRLFIGAGTEKPANVGIITEAKIYLENPTIPGINIVLDEIYGREAELTFTGERSVEDTFKVIEERLESELNN